MKNKLFGFVRRVPPTDRREQTADPPPLNRLAGVVLDKNYKLGLHHEATPETRQQLIGCILGVWLFFFGRTMKKLTLTTWWPFIVTVAGVTALSVIVTQQLLISQRNSQMEQLNTDLDNAQSSIDNLRAQVEVAKADLHGVRRELAKQNQRADQQQLEIERAAAENKHLRVVTANLQARDKRVAQLAATSKKLQAKYSLKLAEYETFVTKAAQELAARDEKISALNAQLSAAQNRN